MHSTSRNPACLMATLGFVAAALFSPPSNVVVGQEFRPPSTGQLPPYSAPAANQAPAGTTSAQRPTDSHPIEHSILETTSQSTTPAEGTFATSNNVPSLPVDDVNETPGLPAIADNELRAPSTERLPLERLPKSQPPPNSNGSAPSDSIEWDEQPTPPIPTQQYDNSRQDTTTSPPSFAPPSTPSSEPTSPPSMSPSFTQTNQPTALAPNQSFDHTPVDSTNTMPPIAAPLHEPHASHIPSAVEQSPALPPIQSAQFQETARGSTPFRSSHTHAVDLKLAQQIMERYQIDRVTDPLPGRPITLLEMLNKTPSHRQRQMVGRYWETHFAWASLLNSSQLLDWLQKLPDPSDPNELSLLKVARESARNKVMANEIRLGKSQAQLQQFLANGVKGPLPLPSDNPLVQIYEPHFQWYETRGRIPPGLAGYDELLKKTIKLVSLRASTVGASRVALSQVRNAYSRNPRSLGSVLEAVRLWSQAEQDLVSTIVSYNQSVADYSLTIARGSKRPSEIVAMLIGKPTSVGSVATRQPLSGSDGRGLGFSRHPYSSGSSIRSQNSSSILSSQNHFSSDPISRTMGERTESNPNRFSNAQPTTRPAGFNRGQLQPTQANSTSQTSQAHGSTPSMPTAQFPSGSLIPEKLSTPTPPGTRSSPATAPPFRLSPMSHPPAQPPQGDRSADRDSNSFGSPAVRPRFSKSANEYKSFGS